MSPIPLAFRDMSETAREFDAIVQSEGLKAARDRRYDDRLADSGGGRGSVRSKQS